MSKSSSFARKQRRRFLRALNQAAADMRGTERMAKWAYDERLLVYDGAQGRLLPTEGFTYESITQAWKSLQRIEDMNRPSYEYVGTLGYHGILQQNFTGDLQVDENGNLQVFR